ncbi:MAG: Nif3-like dinuclear metal center hexameric protein [Phycisphaerales bacterium]|nr:Nif3-like dinuclear metal center hexameric protein [Phycisphaerales bacterium]
MHHLADVVNFLESRFPAVLQEDYDNTGLLLGHPHDLCTGVLCTLDVTPAVVQYAVANNCNLIVAHHPLIWKGLKKIDTESLVGYVVEQLVVKHIGVYAIHTNMDNHLQGVSKTITDLLALNQVHVLLPKTVQGMATHHDATHIGTGAIGYLSNPVLEHVFLDRLKQIFSVPVIKHSALLGKPIHKVALCGGSGLSLLPVAQRLDADVFITADIKYHDYFEAQGKLVLIDIGHGESEQFVAPLLCKILQMQFPWQTVRYFDNTNPVFYY